MPEIEKGVPLPKKGSHSKGTKYPFAKMAIGDSVFFANEPAGANSLPAIGARMYAKASSKKFVSRKMDGGVRIWRMG